MKPHVLKIARLPDLLNERLYDQYEVTDSTENPVDLPASALDVRALLANGESRVSRELIEKLPELEIIVVFGVGYDGVDVQAARERGTRVTHTPDVLTDDVADFAMALLLGIGRRTADADRFVRAGAWSDGPFPFTRKVSGARVGIVGLGRIGKAIARRAAGFDMRIAYTGRTPQDVPYEFIGSVVELAAAVDFLVIAVGGGEATLHLVDTDVLNALGPQGILINVGRGSVVDEGALAAALRDKRIYAAGLDVFEHEPHVHPDLLGLDNVLLTPHMASATQDTRQAMADLTLSNLAAYFARETLPTPIPE